MALRGLSMIAHRYAISAPGGCRLDSAAMLLRRGVSERGNSQSRRGNTHNQRKGVACSADLRACVREQWFQRAERA